MSRHPTGFEDEQNVRVYVPINIQQAIEKKKTGRERGRERGRMLVKDIPVQLDPEKVASALFAWSFTYVYVAFNTSVGMEVGVCWKLMTWRFLISGSRRIRLAKHPRDTIIFFSRSKSFNNHRLDLLLRCYYEAKYTCRWIVKFIESIIITFDYSQDVSQRLRYNTIITFPFHFFSRIFVAVSHR